MDYSRTSLPFKLRKVARYVRLYGLRRTLEKVRAQRHLARRYDDLPPRRAGRRPHPGHVGLIGCGQFGYSTIAYYLKRNFGRVLRACMDPDVHRAASLFEAYDLAYYTDDATELLDDPAIDLVFVASNHASHAEYAIEAIERGKAVHIEKPHCVSLEQLRRLCAAIERHDGRVALGFNRPASAIGERIRAELDAQDGAAMFNWFVAGHRIDPDHWYFRDEEGGRILGNLCHWTDFLLQMLPEESRFPIEISPTRAEQSDANVAVTYRFGDGSIAAITFSAKGHTFEGVRERFAAHKGDLLVSLDDFHALKLEVVERKTVLRSRHRDHGHERRIRNSYRLTGPRSTAESVAYVWNTGLLFLQTKEALERGERLTVEPYEVSYRDGGA